MHAQVIGFGLIGITEEQFGEARGKETATFANLSGLLATIWLPDPETNTYGGLYLWADQKAYERYIKGEVVNAIKADQDLKNVESRDFGVFEDLSSLTMPKLRAASRGAGRAATSCGSQPTNSWKLSRMMLRPFLASSARWRLTCILEFDLGWHRLSAAAQGDGALSGLRLPRPSRHRVSRRVQVGDELERRGTDRDWVGLLGLPRSGPADDASNERDFGCP